ncbi:MAG TPA: YggT family protein [Dehalococcoidia bacterium]
MHALGLFIEILSIFLLVAIILRIVFSWTGFDQRSPIYAAILEVTEPILAPIRSVLPRTGMLDLSPMIATFILFIMIGVGQTLAAS